MSSAKTVIVIGPNPLSIVQREMHKAILEGAGYDVMIADITDDRDMNLNPVPVPVPATEKPLIALSRTTGEMKW